MDTAPYEIDNRVKLNNFGGSAFKTREVKEAINALSKARLLELIYPTTKTSPPLVSPVFNGHFKNFKKSAFAVDTS